jgi:hypothetical protein
MIVLGVVLIVLGLVLSAVVPAYAHLVLVIGLALMLIGRIGHAVGGRRHRSEAATSRTQLKEWDRADQLDPASQTPETPQISMSKKYAGFAVTAVMAAGLGLAGLGAPAEAQAQPGPIPQWCAGPFFDNGFVGIWDRTGCHDIYRGPDRGGPVTTADQRSGGQGPGGH